MNKEIYYNSINVLKGNVLGRDISIGTFIKNGVSALLDINTITYLDLLRIQKKLIDVLADNFKYDYEWSGMRFGFESNKKTTSIEDLVLDTEVIEIKTSLIHELIFNRLKYLDTLNEELILEKIKYGFDTIKSNPSDYRIREFQYKVELSEEVLFFVLLREDFSLSAEEFISSIKVNGNYLPPEEVTSKK